MKKVENMLQKVILQLLNVKYTENDMIDVVVLPELSLSGGSFFDKDEIRPFAEECSKGCIFEWG